MLGTVNLLQIVACVAQVAQAQGQQDLADWVTGWPATIDPPPISVIEKLRVGLTPLTMPALSTGFVIELSAAEEAYLDALARVRQEDIRRKLLTALAFLRRRHRALQGAIWSLEREHEMVGDDFDPGRMAGRELRYILVAEVAGLVARWKSGPTTDALAVAASATRSAFALWLEDDSRAMVVVRAIVENVARARTWRLKPARAQRLEERGARTSTRDWLAAAGWKQLALLNRALGELSHASYESRWSGAVEALAALQPESDSTIAPIHTARGAALDQAVYLLACESVEQLKVSSPTLAKTFGQLLGLAADPGAAVETWLRRAWEQRRFDFGAPDLVPIPAEELRRLGITNHDAGASSLETPRPALEGDDP